MLRWIKRIVFGLVAVVAIVVVGTIVFFNTNYGRDKLRGEIETKLADTFAFGATVGHVDGTPFGELVLHAVVINGPDGKPAISIGTLHVRMRLVDLMVKDVRLGEVLAEDVDIQVRRDAQGRFQVTQLLKQHVQAVGPPPPATKPTWNIDMPSIELRRAHVLVDTGSPDLQIVNLDAVDATATAHLPADGARTVTLKLAATWRERAGAPVEIEASARDTVEMLTVPSLAVRVGGVALTAAKLEIVMRDDKLPLVGGGLQITAPAAAVAALLPRILLPADVVLSLSATRGELSTIGIHGTIGPTPITADLVADVDHRHATGKLVAGDLDLAALTRGKVIAVAGGAVDFDVALGAAGMLPTANLVVTGHGTFEDLPRADFTASVSTAGQRISTRVTATGAAAATIEADLDRTAEGLVLERSHVVASGNPPRGPLHGAVAVDLAIHGELLPAQDLAVTGTITGSHLRMQDLSVASAHIAVNATGLPHAPRGTGSAQLVQLVSGSMQLGALEVTAATRADDKIAVQLVSHPLVAPWLVELAALVTPPARDGTIVVDLGAHHVRAGTAGDWTGSGGRVAIGPARIDLAGLRSTSAEGNLAVSGSFARATGDLGAQLDLESFALGALQRGYGGLVSGHVTAARRGGSWSGDADVKGTGVVVAGKPPVDLAAKIAAKPGSVTLTGTASSKGYGAVKLALDLAAPARLDDVAAWQRSSRSSIRSAKLALEGIDLARVAPLANQEASGRLDGEIDLTATTVGGALHVVNLQSPLLRGVRSANVDLALAQAKPDEIDPTLTVALADLGKLTVTAQLAVPQRIFDPKAWGLDSVRGATLQTDRFAIDPAMLDRLHIASTLSGAATLHAEIGPGARTVTVTGDVTGVRATALAQALDLHVVAGLDAKGATAKVSVSAKGVALVELDATAPATIEKLRTDPKAIPITGTIALPKAPAAKLLALLGRSEITAGTVDGKVDIAGTIGKPTLHAKLVAANLEMPPGPGGKPVAKLQQLAIDATWADGAGDLTIDGSEVTGAKLAVKAHASPGALASGTATIVATHFDLTPLLVFAPGPAGGSRATLDANLTMKGLDPRTAQLLGELHVANGRIPIAPTVGTLRDAKIDIVVHEHDIAVTTTGKLGAGDVKLTGSIALDGASLTGGKATITLRKVSPIGQIEPVIDADIAATLSHKDDTWNADLVVDHGLVKVSTKQGEKLKEIGNPVDLTVGRGKQPAKPTVTTPPAQPIFIAKLTLHDTKVESGDFRTVIRGTLTASADASHVGLVGTVEAIGGDVDLFDQRYKIETAIVSFDGSTDPTILVRITHDFPDVETVTQVHGRLSKPELELSANPNQYTQSQLLGFLLGGEPSGDPRSASAQDRATGAGASLIAGQLAGYVKKALPFDIDVIRYEAATIDNSSAITVGTWVSHTLFLAFRQHLESRPDENSGEATAEYWLTKRLEVEGTAGDRGYDGIDLIWRKRF